MKHLHKLLIIFGIIALIVVNNLAILHKTILSERIFALHSTVDVAKNVLEYYYLLEKYGKSHDDATREALAIINSMHYGKDGYIFVFDYKGNNILAPGKPERQGHNFLNEKDVNGVFFIKELLDNAISRNEKAVFYQFPRYGQQTPSNKVSYSAAFEPWEWIIGTGVYMDDITGQFINDAKTLIWILIIVMCFVAVYMFQPIALKDQNGNDIDIVHQIKNWIKNILTKS